MTDDELPEVLSPKEIATRERLALTTVIHWCKNGKLPAYKVGGAWRIRRVDYLAFRKPNSPPATAADPARKQKIGGPSRQRAADEYLDRIGA